MAESHGPYGWLIKPIGLTEEYWRLSVLPSDAPNEEISVPLFAKEAQQLGCLTAAPSSELDSE